MTDPNFGVVIRRTSDEPRPAIAADMDTIGLIGPADDADPDIFPLNTNVKGYSDDIRFVGAIGENGFLADALRGINDQLGELQRAAQVIVRCTPRGVNADPNIANQLTIANIVGNSLIGTGIYGFLSAPEDVAAAPRIILAPGYTGILANTVGTVTQVLAGAGYLEGENYALTFTGGGANAVQATGHAVGQADGTLGDAVLDSAGGWYATPPTIAAEAPPAGAGAVTATYTADIDQLANPVCASLPTVLNQLLAHAVVESAGTSQATDENWRETLNSDRLIPLSGGCKVLDPITGNIIVRPWAARFAGAMIRVDHMKGAPFHSAANQPIWGVLGPGRKIRFSITDGANEGQSLLSNNIGILISGSIGNDFAIASGGFVAISTDNAGEDELWRFYNQTRGRDFIHLMLLRLLRYYLGRFNITIQVVQAIVNSMRFMLGNLRSDENILGYEVNFRAVSNSAEEIRKGHLSVAFRAEEPAPLKLIKTESGRYRPAIDAMVLQLEQQLNLVG